MKGRKRRGGGEGKVHEGGREREEQRKMTEKREKEVEEKEEKEKEKEKERERGTQASEFVLRRLVGGISAEIANDL